MVELGGPPVLLPEVLDLADLVGGGLQQLRQDGVGGLLGLGGHHQVVTLGLEGRLDHRAAKK